MVLHTTQVAVFFGSFENPKSGFEILEMVTLSHLEPSLWRF
jgi:hypothetical protein